MQAEQLELFNPNRLPQAPYCTRGKGEAVVIRRLQSALRNPLIQINLPLFTWWLVFDIDHPQSAVAWQDAGLPPPNWVAVNPSNGHAHMVYGLSIPVKTADPEHIKALRYFAAVYDAMAVALKADLNYSGLLTKNPTHEKWRTEWVYNALYELSELAEYVSLTNVQKCAESDSRGFGRNCTVFDKLRLWAYVAVRQYRASSIVAWREAVYAQAQSCNEFESPLSVNEVRAIGKSVAKWVWARDADAEAKFIAKQTIKGHKGGKGNSSAMQAIKGAKGGKAKGLANFNKRVAAEALRADGYTQKEIAEALDVCQKTISNWQKDFNDLFQDLD